MRQHEFVHLHVHSEYSLLDGACRVDALVKAVRRESMRAVALTDHGNLFGAIEFYQTALREGVLPILGCEVYVAPRSRFDRKDAHGGRDSAYHLTLLVRNEAGYRNLLALASAAYREGFYYKPRVDHELLAQRAEGLIALSGCRNGEIATLLEGGREEEAAALAGRFRDLFGRPHFFAEVQDHGLEDQKPLLRRTVELARRLAIPLVATNDVHYLQREDASAHDALLCISTGKRIDDADRLRYPTDQFYLKTPAEMAGVFAEIPEALSNTLAVAERCRLEIPFGQLHLPPFAPPDGRAPSDYLRALCEEGLRRRYGESPADAIRERLAYELGVIEKMGFVSYFLIVWDFIRFARDHGIPVGPGRGSAAGSLVAYTLGITNLDPLRYDLLFERFLNPGRKELPDIDIDFCQQRREEVIHYVKEKYGHDNVSQIITFGTMAARAAVRDVGRVLGIDLPTVDRVAKKVPPMPPVKGAEREAWLRQSIENDPELAAEGTQDPRVARLFDIAVRLEGLSRHASKHAAGVVIADRPLTSYCPLYVNEPDETTQYDMDALSKLGLLKMDFLGLQTLTVIEVALRLIERTRGARPDLDAIPLDDAATYRILQRGETKGIFQLESAGMTDLLQKLRPDRFEDLVAVLALFRPGPLQSGMVDLYVECKHGRRPIEYLHPQLEPILKETNGVILYQEQVMRIANRLAGFSLLEADVLRKAMGKKMPEVLAKFREQFVEGAKRNGIPRDTASQIFDLIQYFAGYGFNKSHSAAYAILSYRTAHLKANHPTEYLAALMTCDAGNTDKVVEYIDECRRLKIPVLAPDVNASELAFAIEGGSVRFGLGAIKNVGDKAIQVVLDARRTGGPFRSLIDFCDRVDHRAVDRKVLESLIKAGAMDGLGTGPVQARRAALYAGAETALRVGGQRQHDRRLGQMTLFDADVASPAGPEPAVAGPPMPDAPPWSEEELLAFEKEILGLYFTSHPLARHERLLRQFSSHSLAQARQLADGEDVVIGGLATAFRSILIKKGPSQGQKMVAFKFQDMTGQCEAVIFPQELEAHRDALVPEAVVFLVARVDGRREEPSLRVNGVIPIDSATERLAGSVVIRLKAAGLDPGILEDLRQVIQAHPGSCPLFLEVTAHEGHRVIVRAGESCSVTPTASFLDQVERAVGREHVALTRKAVQRSAPTRRWAKAAAPAQ